MTLGAVVVLLAVRAELPDPAHPWWSAGLTGVVAMAMAGLAVRGRSQPLAYLSVGLSLTATTFLWLRPWIGLGESPLPQSCVELIEANLIAVAMVGLAWLAVEITWQRRRGSVLDSELSSPPVHHVAAVMGLVFATVLAIACLVLQTGAIDVGQPVTVDVSNAGGWLMLIMFALLLSGSLWDRKARHALPGLYGLGLLAIIVLLDSLEPTARQLLFDVGLAAAVYALSTSLLSRWQPQLTPLAVRAGIPASNLAGEPSRDWLSVVNMLLAAIVTIVEFRVVLTFEELHLRLWGTAAAAMLAVAVAARVRTPQRSPIRIVALLFTAVAAIDFGWAIMPVSNEIHFWLGRWIRLMVVLAAATSVYCGLLVRVISKASDWFRATRYAATILGAVVILSLLVVLALEGVWFDPQLGAPMTGLQIAVVATTLVGLAAALISLAVLPRRDPLDLSNRGRMLYVYAAGAVLSLLFVHIYLTMPELFSGYLLPYWPLVVMGIAYFGVGVSELFTRMKLRVLSEPLERTGVFLPLLPALGFWIHVAAAGPNILWPEYSTVLFVAGLLYVVLSMWRKSFVYGLAAALAGNAGLWALFHEQGASIFTHPQMWFIPPALSVLVAAQLNRQRLAAGQLAGIRYLAVTMIYVSSTGDMFITGVGRNLWLPMLLALLSVAGVFAGILMRVRAFLYLGTSFLMLSLVSMVWHAQRSIGHVWPWWAFGIALGLEILAVFGVFEKKHNEVLLALKQLRQWEK